MPLEYLSFWLRETISNIARNRLMSLVAITTTTVGLLILGTFYLTLANLRTAVDRETQKLDIVVFLSNNITPERRKEIYEAARIPQVKQLKLISRDQALERMKRDLPSIPVEEFKKGNPLKDELHIKLNNPEDIIQVQKYMETIKGVSKVGRDDEVTRVLLKVNRFLAIASVFASLLLGMAILLIIHNAIRLTIFARRREIRIMELVGATGWFIRVPFLLEGVLYGLAGAALATVCLGALWVGISRLDAQLVRILMPLIGTDIWLKCAFALTGAGLAFGFFGSWVSLSRSLNRATQI
ncbi:MAG TPA: permease-like cell division protein FtsX [Abditibacteriaceae bacterium]|jgi:cell division transport system permease protein